MSNHQECMATKETPWANRATDQINTLILGEQFAYVKARLKQQGISITRIPTGYSVVRWGLFKELPTEHEVENFLLSMGVKL